MISSLLGAAYAASVGVIVYHTAQIKILNDLFQEVSTVRELDLSHQLVKPDQLPLPNALVLGKVVSKQAIDSSVAMFHEAMGLMQPFSEKAAQKSEPGFVYRQYLGYHDTSNPPKLFRFPFTYRKHTFYLEGSQSIEDAEASKTIRVPQFLEINLQGSAATQMFDLEFIQQNQKRPMIYQPEGRQILPKRLERYLLAPLKFAFLQKLLRQKHSHNEVGIREGSELLILGKLEEHKISNIADDVFPVYRMNNPRMMIASDTKEFMDFVRMKSEWHRARALRIVWLAVGITAAHLFLVRLPKFYLQDLEE